MADCLTPAQIEGLLAGTLSAEAKRRAEEHASACETCRRQVEARRADDKLLGQIKEARQDETLLQPKSSAAAAQAVPPISEQIEGYEILREIGRGGMGIIYEAIQLKLNRRVALKVLPAIGGDADRSAIVRFRREATAAAKLHHTNIVPIYDFGQSGHRYYYAMELVEGQSLTEMVRRFAAGNAPAASITRLAEIVRGDRPTSPDPDDGSSSDSGLSSGSRLGSHGSTRRRAYYRHVAQWIADAADALHYAHSQGIIHRDIKPANLMLCTDGRIMVLDFGLAKNASELSATMTGSLLGTLRYMSPEQAMAKRMKVDHRTDVYSLGATMYELLTFQPAFRGADEKETLGMIITRDPTPPRKIIPEVPSELQTICHKTLEKDANARYATAKDLADDLRRYVQDMPILAKPVGPLGRAFKLMRRRRAASIAILAVVLLVPATLFGLYSHRRAEEETRHLQEEKCKGLFRQANILWYNQKSPDWATAQDLYQQAIELRPEDFETTWSLANMKKYQYDSQRTPSLLDEADYWLSKAEKSTNPNGQRLWNLRGIIHRNRKHYAEAHADFQRAIKANPANGPSWVNLASLDALEGDIVKAEDGLRKARDIGGEGKEMALLNLAAVQLQLKKVDVIGTLDSLQDRDAVLARLLKARAHLELSDRYEPEEAQRLATGADTTENQGAYKAKVKRVLAMAGLANKQWDQAAKAAQEAITLEDKPPIYAHLVLAIAEAKRGNTGEAGRHWESAVAEHKRKPALRKDLAFLEAGYLWFDPVAELEKLWKKAEEQMKSSQTLESGD